MILAAVAEPPKKHKWIPRKEFLAKKHAGLSVEYVDYEPRGACRELFSRHEQELMVSGPADTGKSRAALEKVNWVAEKYQRARLLMVRKTRKSLTQSAMVTFEDKVLTRPTPVFFHGGDQEYRYPNGSILAVGGMDDPQKILSSEWDLIYAQQAEELEEGDWESMLSRLRNGRVPYQQLLGDCNPGPPSHWILARAASRKLVLLESRHTDNPVIWDAEKGCWTEIGIERISKLDALTGVRYNRLRKGLWSSAEGAVYEEAFDKAVHVVNRFPIPKEWPRYWAFDFGYTNPFAWGAYAEDPDGRLVLYREIYRSHVLVEDHARKILEVTKGDPKPRVLICDHDAEDRATLERHLGMETKGAWKSVAAGIQAVKERLRKAGDGKPRLAFMRDSLVEVDPELLADHKPTCTADEFESYVWDTSNGQRRGEVPVKKYDHGMDKVRYLVTWVDKTMSSGIGNKVFAPNVQVSSTGEEPNLVRPSMWRMQTNAPCKWGA